MKIIRLKGSLRDRQEIENLKADNSKKQAQIDYLAMMTEVGLPEEEKDEQIRES